MTYSTAEEGLLQQIKTLGYPAAIFPGDEQVLGTPTTSVPALLLLPCQHRPVARLLCCAQTISCAARLQARAGIDAAVVALEAATLVPSPLQQPQRGGQPAPELLGDWKLVYASSGTYVTRTAAAQALLAASKLPGVGVSDVQQTLELSAVAEAGRGDAQSSSGGAAGAAQVLRITNAAKLGLFVFGEWALQITGEWRVQDSVLATISFDGYSLQLVGLLGLVKLPAMAKASSLLRSCAVATAVRSLPALCALLLHAHCLPAPPLCLCLPCTCSALGPCPAAAPPPSALKCATHRPPTHPPADQCASQEQRERRVQHNLPQPLAAGGAGAQPQHFRVREELIWRQGAGPASEQATCCSAVAVLQAGKPREPAIGIAGGSGF